MEPFVIIFYLLLFCFFITTIPFFKNAPLGKGWLIALFVAKVAAGFLYARFYLLPRYNQGSDTWRFYTLSITETQMLLNNPIAFITDLFTYGYSDAGNLFSGENTYWNDLKSNVPVKMMAVMNIFTGNSYYANIVFFNFLFLFGLVGLYRLVANIYPVQKTVIITGIFLLPSTLFWCSGIHKDGLILSALGLVFYCFYRASIHCWRLRYIIIVAVCFVLIFALRNYVLLALLPALLCFLLVTYWNKSKLVIYTAIYIVGIIVFFALPFILPAVNLPAFIANKQTEFLKLEGGSAVYSHNLKPNITGFFKFLPKALDMAFLQPRPTQINSYAYLPAMVEVMAFASMVMWVIIRYKKLPALPPIMLSMMLFAISVLLICGYTIPFTGAMVRYRSLVFPFLITPLLCSLILSYRVKNNQ